MLIGSSTHGNSECCYGVEAAITALGMLLVHQKFVGGAEAMTASEQAPALDGGSHHHRNFKEPLELMPLAEKTTDGVMVRTPRLDDWWRLGADVAMGSFCWLRFHPFLFGKKGVVRRPHRVMCWHETWVCLHTTDWCWTRPGKKPAKAATNWSSHKLEQPFNCMAKATDATAGSLLAPTHSCPLLMIANISTVLYNQWM